MSKKKLLHFFSSDFESFIWFRAALKLLFFFFDIYGFDVICFFTERGVCVPPRTDDEFLIRFLRARFFKLEHAYNLVSNEFICILMTDLQNFPTRQIYNVFYYFSCVGIAISANRIQIYTSTCIHSCWQNSVKMILFRWLLIVIKTVAVLWFTSLEIGDHQNFHLMTYSEHH